MQSADGGFSDYSAGRAVVLADCSLQEQLVSTTKCVCPTLHTLPRIHSRRDEMYPTTPGQLWVCYTSVWRALLLSTTRRVIYLLLCQKTSSVLWSLQIHPQHFPSALLSDNIFPVLEVLLHSLYSTGIKHKQKHDINMWVSCVKLH